MAGRGTRRGRFPAVVARRGVDLYPTVGREGPATAGGLVPTPMVGPPEAPAAGDEPVPTPMAGVGDVAGGGGGVSRLRPPPTPTPPPGGVTCVMY